MASGKKPSLPSWASSNPFARPGLTSTQSAFASGTSSASDKGAFRADNPSVGAKPAFGTLNWTGGDPLAAFTSASKAISFSSFSNSPAQPLPVPSATGATPAEAPAALVPSSSIEPSKVTAPVKRKRPGSPEGQGTDAERNAKESLPGHTDADEAIGADGATEDVSASGSDAESGDSQGSESSAENPSTSGPVAPQMQYKHRFKRARFEEAALATGEEHEVAVYQGRAKAFVLDKSIEGGKWRECGMGPIRLNVRTDIADKINGKKSSPEVSSPVAVSGPIARILMRQEHKPGGRGTKVLINAALWAGMTVQLHSSDVTAVQVNAYVSEVPKVLLDDKKPTAATSSTTIPGGRRADKEKASSVAEKDASVTAGKAVGGGKEIEGEGKAARTSASSSAVGAVKDKPKDSVPNVHDPFHFLLRFGRPELAKEFVSVVGRYKESLAPFFHLPAAKPAATTPSSTSDAVPPATCVRDAAVAPASVSSSKEEDSLSAPPVPTTTQDGTTTEGTHPISSKEEA